MARTAEQLASATLGDLLMQIIRLRAELEAAQERLAALAVPSGPKAPDV